jgi:hypothetical protein
MKAVCLDSIGHVLYDIAGRQFPLTVLNRRDDDDVVARIMELDRQPSCLCDPLWSVGSCNLGRHTHHAEVIGFQDLGDGVDEKIVFDFG